MLCKKWRKVKKMLTQRRSYDSKRSKMLHVGRKIIMWKAKSIFNKKNDHPAIKDLFVASRGWCEKFMRRHGFSLRRKTTTA